VIALHDMGIDEPSQTPYLVMEFIQGQPLEKLLEKRQPPLLQSLRLGCRGRYPHWPLLIARA